MSKGVPRVEGKTEKTKTENVGAVKAEHVLGVSFGQDGRQCAHCSV